MNRRERRAESAKTVKKPPKMIQVPRERGDAELARGGPFFHVSIGDGDKTKDEKNLSGDAVVERVAVPYQLRTTVRVDGVEFRASLVRRLRITRTDLSIDPAGLLKQLDTTSFSSVLVGIAEIGQRLGDGEDVTDQILALGDEVIAARGLTAAKVGAFDTQIVADKAFVVMSFAPELNQTFEAIATACTDHGVKAVRADQEISSKAVMDRVLAHLKDASYVIGDLTNARPNVYYELGYFDAVCAARSVDASRHLLLVARDMKTDAHFDLKHRGIEEYDNPFTLMKRVSAWFDALGVARRR